LFAVDDAKQAEVGRALLIVREAVAVRKRPEKVDETKEAPKTFLLHLKWRDLVVVVIGLALGLWLNAHYFKFKEPSDYQKWVARPKLGPVAEQDASRRVNPCLFIVPPGARNQPVVSGSVGECLILVPDGKILDIFEVSLWWGNFVHIKTDLFVPDRIPLAFTRTSTTDYMSTRNRTYLRHVYEPYLVGDRNPYTYLRCFLPDGINLTYQRISPGKGFVDAVYEDASPFPIFQGSRFAWNGWGWDLALRSGMTYLFPEAYTATRPQQGSLVGIFDGNGNEVQLKRKGNGDLAEITSPGGGRINFFYDKGLISRVADSLGNSAAYIYDERHNLKRAINSNGESEQYEYNLFRHVVRILDSKGSMILENIYDPHDRENKVVHLALRDGGTYRIDYAFEKQGGRGYVEITDSKGEVTRINLEPEPGENRDYYSVEASGHSRFTH